MEHLFSKEIQAGLDAARQHHLRRKSRLRVDVNGTLIPLLKMRKNGFTVAVEDAPSLRGLVDVFDGARHLFQCLIVASAEEQGEMHYEFKRATPATTVAPSDFERRVDAPIGLIERG